MPSEQNNDEVCVRLITELRTCTVQGDPKTVVLVITSRGHVAHYGIAISDLAALSQRLGADAALLGTNPRIRFA